jgi:cytochrome c
MSRSAGVPSVPCALAPAGAANSAITSAVRLTIPILTPLVRPTIGRSICPDKLVRDKWLRLWKILFGVDVEEADVKRLVLSMAVLAFSAGSAVAQTAAPDLGKRAFLQCRACHNLKAGEPHKVGPNLHGFMGTKAGELGGFNFSDALKKSGLVWDDKTLDRWIENPSALVKGHKMAYIGMRDPKQRAALIEFLKRETK